MTRTEAQAAGKRAKAATRSIPMGSTETRRLGREQRETLHDIAFTDVPALVAALEEAQSHLGSLLPMVDPRFYDNGATMLAEAQRCNAEYNGREGGS